MKKRIITLLLALTCCIPLFVGCDKNKNPDADTSDAGTTEQPEIITGTITNWKVPTPEKGSDGLYRIIVNDFERPADISPLIAGQVNTAAEVEKKIVHSGNQSLKIRRLPENSGYNDANLRQPLNLLHRKNYSDLKYVKKISFWAYNAQSKDMDITMTVTFSGDTSPAVTYTKTIPAKQWTEVVVDMTQYTIPNKAAERLTFSFTKHSFVQETVFYIDDVCLHSTIAK